MSRHSIDETAQMAERYKMFHQHLLQNQLFGSSISISTGDKMKTTVSDFLNLMNKNDPAVIGNKIPDENFYYIDGK